MDPLLRVSSLSKNYIGDKSITSAVKNITFDVNNGEFIVLVGPSGCGKSTILSIIGGLEKTDGKGEVSTDNLNHEKMVHYRKEKIDRLAERLPLQEVYGDEDAELLVVGWGGTHGALKTAVNELRAEGKKVAYTHFHYISPLPKNTEEILRKYKKIVVCELNMGQFVNYLRMNYQGIMFHQYNKVQGLPFEVTELKQEFNKIMNGGN